jgi:hypothetical protein
MSSLQLALGLALMLLLTWTYLNTVPEVDEQDESDSTFK